MGLESNPPDWEAFGRQLMECWGGGGDLDVFDLQAAAVRHRVLIEAPNGYDPEINEDAFDAKIGDTWYVRNYAR